MSRPTTSPTYDVAGPADAPAIVFIHGTHLSRSSWAPQLAALQDDYRVVVLDLPGHGALADRRFTIDAAADEVGRVIDTAVGGRAVVVGLSLGGYVAMELAARPSTRVRGLVLSGATQEPVGALAAPYRTLAWAVERLAGPRLDAATAWLFRARFGRPVAESVLAGGLHAVGGAAALRALAGQRFIPRLAAYDGPVLIINGERDVLFRLGAGPFARAARDARRVRIRGATHLANLERPDVFNALIRDFMEGLRDRP